jgi:hypothetical protein
MNSLCPIEDSLIVKLQKIFFPDQLDRLKKTIRLFSNEPDALVNSLIYLDRIKLSREFSGKDPVSLLTVALKVALNPKKHLDWATISGVSLREFYSIQTNFVILLAYRLDVNKYETEKWSIYKETNDIPFPDLSK